MTRGRVVVRGRSGGVHNKEWTSVCINSTAIDLAIGSVAAFVMLVADEAETLLRTRGSISMVLDAPGIDEDVTIAVGLAMVSAKSAAAGVTAIPLPNTEGSFPWLWHGWLFGSTFAGNNGGFLLGTHLEVDSKAMRKVKEDEVMILKFEMCESQDAGGVVNLLAGFRILSGD